jgi:hypothetical protein
MLILLAGGQMFGVLLSAQLAGKLGDSGRQVGQSPQFAAKKSGGGFIYGFKYNSRD